MADRTYIDVFFVILGVSCIGASVSLIAWIVRQLVSRDRHPKPRGKSDGLIQRQMASPLSYVLPIIGLGVLGGVAIYAGLFGSNGVF